MQNALTMVSLISSMIHYWMVLFGKVSFAWWTEINNKKLSNVGQAIVFGSSYNKVF